MKSLYRVHELKCTPWQTDFLNPTFSYSFICDIIMNFTCFAFHSPAHRLTDALVKTLSTFSTRLSLIATAFSIFPFVLSELSAAEISFIQQGKSQSQSQSLLSGSSLYSHWPWWDENQRKEMQTQQGHKHTQYFLCGWIYAPCQLRLHCEGFWTLSCDHTAAL